MEVMKYSSVKAAEEKQILKLLKAVETHWLSHCDAANRLIKDLLK